eukprot:26516-Alexandrium_andersonii.AAC.1
MRHPQQDPGGGRRRGGHCPRQTPPPRPLRRGAGASPGKGTPASSRSARICCADSPPMRSTPCATQ